MFEIAGDALLLSLRYLYPNKIVVGYESNRTHKVPTKRLGALIFLVVAATFVSIWLPLSWHFRFLHVGGDGDSSSPWSFASYSSDEQPPLPVPPVRYENGMLYLNYEEDSRGEPVCDTATRVFIAIESAAGDQDSRMAARNTCVDMFRFSLIREIGTLPSSFSFLSLWQPSSLDSGGSGGRHN
jgi:hypothetical protein